MPGLEQIFSLIPDMLARLVESGRPWIEHYGLWAVGLGLFCETFLFAGVIAPGFAVMITAGFLAAAGALPGWQALLLGIAGAVLGDQASYLLGRLLGTRVLWRFARHSDGVRRALESEGPWLLLAYHYALLVRAVLPCIAGSTGYAYRRFSAMDACGAALWVGALFSIGYSAQGLIRSQGNLLLLLLNLCSITLLLAVTWRVSARVRTYLRAAAAGG